MISFGFMEAPLTWRELVGRTVILQASEPEPGILPRIAGAAIAAILVLRGRDPRAPSER